MATPPTAPHACAGWLHAVQGGLDALEQALLQGDALAVEKASMALHLSLQQHPEATARALPGSTLRAEIEAAARRFAQLRQALLRASAQSQRAVASLLPQPLASTYGRAPGAANGGAGRTYLSA
ncbi:hypothetical protein [Hydrogenophaga sp.]|uniref:hypothetical protein n=1 Tax=Hydrogenophaga sp. TaxID=1904254 RepID=UPI00198E773E|nr:hypothetical protein [Hydrogenophaga sp.]MBD3892594.1 hypothetical protein [Hydrogenophaga sp.]